MATTSHGLPLPADSTKISALAQQMRAQSTATDDALTTQTVTVNAAVAAAEAAQAAAEAVNVEADAAGFARTAPAIPTEKAEGGFLDDNNRLTWLTHDETGGPTDYAMERLGVWSAEVTGATGGFIDKDNRLTWLTHDETGGLTGYAISRITEALGIEPSPIVAPTNRHPVLENDLRMANGGTIRTAGAAPVCLIFDHGLNNFRDIVLPLLTARGLSSVMAINGNLHKPGYNIESESSNVTWAEIDGWTSVEIANHGAAHSNSPYPVEQMETEIVGSLNDLKANLPSKQIRTWVQPAADYPEDFNNGDSVHSYADTATGKLILEHHAVATGMWRTPTHPLIPRDGTILQGITGYWIDTAGSTTAAKNHITAAAAQGKGILIRNHPRVIDVDSTRLSTTELTGFLDFLKAEQDAGRIKVMTLSQWAIADTGL